MAGIVHRGHDHNDPPLPPGAHAYLEAFDRYLAAVIDHDRQVQAEARRQMRVRCHRMLDEQGVDPYAVPRYSHRQEAA